MIANGIPLERKSPIRKMGRGLGIAKSNQNISYRRFYHAMCNSCKPSPYLEAVMSILTKYPSTIIFNQLLDEMYFHMVSTQAVQMQIRSHIASIAKEIQNDEDRFELAFYIYWETDLPVSCICEIYGIKRMSQLPELSFATEKQFSCTACGQAMMILVTSRSDFMQKESFYKGKHGGKLLCPTCEIEQKRKDAASRAEFEARERAYHARLETLATMPYAEYLKTDEWKDRRNRLLRRARYRCRLCNSPDQLNVHHRTYDRRGNEHDDDLIVLCQTCHAKFHDKLGGGE